MPVQNYWSRTVAEEVCQRLLEAAVQAGFSAVSMQEAGDVDSDKPEARRRLQVSVNKIDHRDRARHSMKAGVKLDFHGAAALT